MWEQFKLNDKIQETDDKKSVILSWIDYQAVQNKTKQIIENEELLSNKIEEELEKSSISDLDERWEVAEFLIKNFKNRDDIYKNIQLIIENEAEVLEDVKMIIDVEKEEQDIEKEEQDIEKEIERIEFLKNNKKEKVYKLSNLKYSRKEENQEVKEENQEVKEENQEINNYKKIITFLSNSKQLDWNNSKYWNILKNLIHKYKENKNNFEITDIKGELEKLSQPDIFVAFANDLGWPNSIEYKHFKSLVKNTSSWNDFEWLFRDYESLDWTTISADKVIEWIEKDSWGLVDVELGERPPVSRLRLLGSDYGFDKEIDKKALAEITGDSKEELNEIKKFGFDVLKDFRQNFAKETFDFAKMQDMYDYFEIENNDQIQLNDLEDFRNAETREEKLNIFKNKKEEKLKKIENIIKEKQTWILKKYESEIKELLIREKTRKKEQLETLEFLHNIWFDLIKQADSDKIINMINSSEALKSKFWFDKKIDLANWDLWINLDSDFKNNSIEEERVFARFVNKMISWNENHPIEISSMSHWVPVFKSELWEEILDKKAYVNRKLQYGYASILENLWLNWEKKK